mmetsp:Transcript_12069/g.36782  ORF Transcript_12069/g.36782 Transcript_12069/m.36782 type:complete len:209 (+) Transcript_12069:3735-4361(+)
MLFSDISRRQQFSCQCSDDVVLVLLAEEGDDLLQAAGGQASNTLVPVCQALRQQIVQDVGLIKVVESQSTHFGGNLQKTSLSIRHDVKVEMRKELEPMRDHFRSESPDAFLQCSRCSATTCYLPVEQRNRYEQRSKVSPIWGQVSWRIRASKRPADVTGCIPHLAADRRRSTPQVKLATSSSDTNKPRQGPVLGKHQTASCKLRQCEA